MAPPNIPAERAGALTQARILEILSTKLSTEIDSRLNRNGSDEIQPSDGDYAGLYVPDPTSFIEEPAPTRKDVLEIDTVALYSGQRGEATLGGETARGSGGSLRSRRIPWAVSFVFAHAPGPTISHPALSRNLKPEEIVEQRAQVYRDMIAVTLDIWGMTGSGSGDRDAAVNGISLESTFGAALRIRVGEEEQRLRGAGFVSFEIDQWVQYPPHQQL